MWGCVLVWLTGCASSRPPAEPSVDAPRVGCIADSPFAPFQKLGPGGSRLLPEIIRVIGETLGIDGQRWMVFRGGYYDAAKCRGELLWDYDSCPWVPFEKEKIQFMGCGPEAEAYAVRGKE